MPRDIQPIPGLGPITTLRTHTSAPTPRPPSWDKYLALEVPPTPEAAHTSGPGPIYDIWPLVGIYIMSMLILSWILFGVVWVKKGIQMNNRAAKILEENLHATTYFIEVITVVVLAFFPLALFRFFQLVRYPRLLRASGHRLWGKSSTYIKYLSGHTHDRTSSASCESFLNMEDIQPSLGPITTLRPHTLPPGPGIFIMLIWPWILFGVVWVKEGMQMNKHADEIVKNPRATAYFITVIISIVVTALFSFPIILFAQQLVTYRRPIRPFHLKVLPALHTWPWGKSWKDIKYLMDKTRWWPAALVVFCILNVPRLMSSTTSLLTPVPFHRMENLSGIELSFSSNDIYCLVWFKAKPQMADFICFSALGRGNVSRKLTSP